MNIAVFFNSTQTLRSVPRDGEQYIAVLGDITVDLRQVSLPEALRLSALAILGDVKLTVPAGTDIVWSGFALLPYLWVVKYHDQHVRQRPSKPRTAHHHPGARPRMVAHLVSPWPRASTGATP
jgi:hypothetical protein